MEIHTQPKDNENSTISKDDEYYDNPCKLDCKICLKEVTTYMTEEYNYYSWILSFIFTFIFGIFIGFPISVLTFLLCKNKIHRCCDCLNVLYIKRFSTISFKGDTYVQFKVDSCIIIIRRIYVYILLFLLIVSCVSVTAYKLIYTMENNNNSEEIDKSSYISAYLGNYKIDSNIQWQNLIDLCGSKVIVNNAARAQQIFEDKFKNRIVKWKGHFIGQNFMIYNQYNYNSRHIANYYVRMVPSESLNNPDLILTLSQSVFSQYKNSEFNHGSPIEFKAILIDIGNEWKPFTLQLVEINQIEEFIKPNEKIRLFEGVNINIDGYRNVEHFDEKPSVIKIDSNSNNEKSEENNISISTDP